MFIRGVLIGARHFWWPLQHKRALVRCPCAFRLCRRCLLTQTGCHRDLSRNPLVTLGQIALVVVRCEFWQSRRSCAEILTRRSFIESLRRHLARAPLMEILCREFFLRSCREILPRGLLQRSCQQNSCTNFHRDLFKGSCQETSSRELVQRSCQEVSYRNLAKRALLESLCRYLWNRSCQETCYKLGTRTESLPRDLL